MMITAEGPKVVEFNCRLGDPETQAILPLLRTDILEIFESCVDRRLNSIKVDWRKDASVAVVLASGGYPSTYTTGYPIDGLALDRDSVNVFHAGTKLDGEGKIITNGGRVLAVNALAPDINQAAEVVYENIREITFSNMYYRTDIAK